MAAKRGWSGDRGGSTDLRPVTVRSGPRRDAEPWEGFGEHWGDEG